MSARPKNRMGDEVERLIKAIGDCKSKSEEDRIMYRAIESTKASVKSGKVDKQRTRDFLIKMLYFEMLGHDASFGHFLAVQACGSNSVLTKLVGYLAVSQFLDASDSLILLLVNTWRSDLQNDNHIIVCAALTAACKLVNDEAIGALVSQVVTLTSHSKETVRKKAVMALHRFSQIDPRTEGGLAGIDLIAIYRKTLCDKDPSVMSATLCALQELASQDPIPYRNLIPSLSSIIKQIVEHRLSKSYEYHHCPAPYIQIRLLRIFGVLGKGDKPSTDNLRNIILNVLRNASPRNTIGFAVLFECIRTITTISPDPVLMEAAAKSVFTFLRSDNSHNLKYMGLDALGGIVSINFRQAQEHQTAVMDCLEDPDDTLKLKTLQLLYKMTQSSNVEIVVEKLIQYLKTCSDEHVSKDICSRISDLAERYAPDTLWYVETMIEMFEAGGDTIPAHGEHNLMKLIAEQDEDLHKSAIEICLGLTDKPKLPQKLLQVVCWILGEYGSLVQSLSNCDLSITDVQEKLCELIQISNPDKTLQGYILTAILKLSSKQMENTTIDVEDLVRKSLSSKSIDLQQRALELQSLTGRNKDFIQRVLPFDASCEDLNAQLKDIEKLSFLNNFVEEALRNGANAYVPESERDDFGVSLAQEKPDIPLPGLRYEAYQKPTFPVAPVEQQPVAVMETPEAWPEVGVASIAQPEDKFKLPVPSRRWGPAQPEPNVADPPVIHLDHMKLQYTHPGQIPETDASHRRNGSVEEASERDQLSASLFGGGTPNSTTRSRKFLDRGQRSPERRTKTQASQIKTPPTPPTGDLLDLLDLAEPSSAPAQPQTDPFAGVDFLSGTTNGTMEPQPAAPAPSTFSQGIDLDALYNSTPSTMQGFSSMPPPMMQTTSMLQSTPMMAHGVGLRTGVPSSLPKLNKPTKKDDPFKDLLG